MIVRETFLSCDGCGKNYGVDTRQFSGTKQRECSRKSGWKLIVGDAYKYGDYCPECLKAGKHKKVTFR